MPKRVGGANPPRSPEVVADEVIALAARHREVFTGPVLKMTGLKPLELRLLLGIHRLPGATIKQVGEAVNASPASLRHALHELRQRGLVDAKEVDKRRSERFLTTKGKTLLAHFVQGYENLHPH